MEHIAMHKRQCAGLTYSSLPLKSIDVTCVPAEFALLKYFKGDQVIFDAILTACSISATYMMTKKWIENWLCWVLIDFAYIVLYGIKDLWLYAILYFVFTLMAAYGFYTWKKQKS